MIKGKVTTDLRVVDGGVGLPQIAQSLFHISKSRSRSDRAREALHLSAHHPLTLHFDSTIRMRHTT